jgi:thioredoxin 1
MNTGENIVIPGRVRVQATPTLMLFRDGKVVGQIVGPTPSRLKRAIDTLLAE